jgi:serine/threonine protein phosphatase PrpC
MKGFSLKAASIIGREHQRLWKNNQDGLSWDELSIGAQEYLFGVISDGCGQGLESEVGAKLLADFAANQIPFLLRYQIPLPQLPQTLYWQSVNYLSNLTNQTITNPEKKIQFVQNNLLATLLGVIMDQSMTIVFSVGDGLIIVNDQIEQINQDNQPFYLAYHLISPEMFEVPKPLVQQLNIRIFSTGDLKRLAVASDGLEKELVNRIWSHPTNISLQRELKRLSRQEQKLTDDCSVIVVERN